MITLQRNPAGIKGMFTFKKLCKMLFFDVDLKVFKNMLQLCISL